MLTKEERQMITAITAAAVLVSAASVVSIVKDIATPTKSDTHVYLSQATPQTIAPTGVSAQSPTCAPIVFTEAFIKETHTVSTASLEAPAEEVEAHTYIPTIPLSEEYQMIMQQSCDEYGVPYSLALAVCEAESTFNPDADSGICWGFMQINPVNYTWLRNIGIEPTTYSGNIEAGVCMLGQLLEKYDDTHKALMAYNCGDAGAANLWNLGYFTSSYSENVVEKDEKWHEIIADYSIIGG